MPVLGKGVEPHLVRVCTVRYEIRFFSCGAVRPMENTYILASSVRISARFMKIHENENSSIQNYSALGQNSTRYNDVI